MGFLSAYSGTRRLDVGGGYWIEIKTCLSVVEKHRAERALGGSNPTFDMNGNGTAKLDTAAFATEMVAASISDWNLDEDDGAIWPLAPDQVKRANIARLPASVFDTVFAAVNESNGPRPAGEQARFPESGVGGGTDGVGRAAELEQLHP